MDDKNEYWVEVAGRRGLIRAKSAREAANFECAKNAYVPGTSIAVQLRGGDDETVTYLIAQDAVSQERYVTRATNGEA